MSQNSRLSLSITDAELAPTKPAAASSGISTPVPTVVENMPSKFLATGLPSNCYPYGKEVNEIHVRRLSVADVMKLQDAAEEKSMQMVAEVIGATLYQFPWAQLTLGDFWYLMYWHRLHSFPKYPHKVRWLCQSEGHLRELAAGKKTALSLQQESETRMSNLDIVKLNIEAYDAKIEEIKADFGVSIQVMRIGDYCQAVEFEREDEDELATSGKRKYTTSYLAMAKKACMLSVKEYGDSLKDRIAFLSAYEDPGLVWALDEFLSSSDHGVLERFKVTCGECGASSEVETSVDALTFLSSV